MQLLLQKQKTSGNGFFSYYERILVMGLIPALQEVMLGSHHRFCSRHIWQSFAKKWNGLDFKGALFSCAKAMTPQEFDAAMDRELRG
ncbi:hypothetical protein AHAS_Ahas15G0295000 [Arachis hypogaea]